MCPRLLQVRLLQLKPTSPGTSQPQSLGMGPVLVQERLKTKGDRPLWSGPPALE